MVQTARDFISYALKEAGVIGQGETALSQVINDGFITLNRMLAQWQKKRWLVPNLYELSKVANGAKSNLIGPGQFWNAARPDKIQAAYFRQLNGNSPDSTTVDFPLIQITSWEDYSRITLKELQSWPQYFFYDGAFPYGNVYIWPIPTSAYEISLVLKGPIGFTIQLQEGTDGGTIEEAGEAYTDGAYVAVPVLSLTGYGSGATADVTIAGGVVTSFTVLNGGDGYKINDTLSVNSADVGGTGTGFVWRVNKVTDSLDADFNMPPEYEEGINYNLVVRLTAFYQYAANPIHGALAKNGLNTIRIANAQIPMLQMPKQYRFNRGAGGNFYIFNADAR